MQGLLFVYGTGRSVSGRFQLKAARPRRLVHLERLKGFAVTLQQPSPAAEAAGVSASHPRLGGAATAQPHPGGSPLAVGCLAGGAVPPSTALSAQRPGRRAAERRRGVRHQGLPCLLHPLLAVVWTRGALLDKSALPVARLPSPASRVSGKVRPLWPSRLHPPQLPPCPRPLPASFAAAAALQKQKSCIPQHTRGPQGR